MIGLSKSVPIHQQLRPLSLFNELKLQVDLSCWSFSLAKIKSIRGVFFKLGLVESNQILDYVLG